MATGLASSCFKNGLADRKMLAFIAIKLKVKKKSGVN
jgi:hypothetical protein